jgi:tetratricopeptide (TPR) repeat protein
MKKLSIYFPSLAVLLLLFASCSQREWYKKEVLDKEKYAEQLRIGGGYHYQGSVAEQFQLEEAMKLDSTDGSLWREIATAPLKRGIADKAFYYYQEGVKRKPEKWMGFRGYCYLYFYRDYERAIADFNNYDELMGQVEYSQGRNHDYMRGIAYYGLKDYSEAFNQLDRYIETATKEDGEDWVDVYAFLYRGLTHSKFERIEEAIADFDRVLKYYPKLSDAYFHKARMLVARENFSDALELLDLAKEYHQQGYFNQEPYVEVIEQIYLEDIEELRQSISSI